MMVINSRGRGGRICGTAGDEKVQRYFVKKPEGEYHLGNLS
jgi:hypothetical protein